MVYSNNLPVRFGLAENTSLSYDDYIRQRNMLLTKNEHGFADKKRPASAKAQSYSDASFNFRYPSFKTPYIDENELTECVFMNISQMSPAELRMAVYYKFCNKFGSIMENYAFEFDTLQSLLTLYNTCPDNTAETADKIKAELKRITGRFSYIGKKEKILNARLTEMRSELYRKQLSPAPDENSEPYTVSLPFYKVKRTYEQSRLFYLFKSMPKMGLLHMHTSASVSPEWIIDTLVKDADNNYAKYGKCYMILGDDKNKRGTLTFKEPSHGPYALVTRDLIYSHNGGRLGTELPELLSFRSDRINRVGYIWDEFNAIFARTGGLLDNSAFYKDYYIEAFKTLVDDNIEYLELRSGFGKFDGNDDETLFLRLLKEAENEANTYAQSVRKQFKLRVILCGNRAKSRRFDALKKMILAAKLANKEKYKDFIIGFDTVSEEDRGKGTQYYAEFIVKSRIYKLLGFYFHDGETSWDFNNNMIDGILLSDRRIGHGFGLHKFPQLVSELAFEENTPIHSQLNIPRHPSGGNTANAVAVDDYFTSLDDMVTSISAMNFLSDNGKCTMLCDKAEAYMSDKDLCLPCDTETRSIALEICPISNQMLRYTPDLRMHPANELLHQGIQCVLANDDPQIFGNSGLTYDLISAFLAWDLDLWQIKQLIVNSVVYSAIPRKYNYDENREVYEECDSYYDDVTFALNRFNVLWHRFLIDKVPETTDDDSDNDFGGYRKPISDPAYVLDEYCKAADENYISYIT